MYPEERLTKDHEGKGWNGGSFDCVIRKIWHADKQVPRWGRKTVEDEGEWESRRSTSKEKVAMGNWIGTANGEGRSPAKKQTLIVH